MVLNKKRIFIIEDDAYNLGIITSLLTSQGAVVDFDGWGIQTIDRIRKFMPIDLILLDLMLPQNISGYDIFDKIRARDELKDVPVIIVSASDPDVEMRKARKKGCAGFIRKPLRFNTFARQIVSVLNGEEIWGDE